MQAEIPETLLSGLSDLLAARIGLHFPQTRWRDLERGIAAAAREFGKPDTESCMRWLLSAPLTHSQVKVLARHLTVGETYFLRDRRSFEVFEEHVFPELIESRKVAARRLRIWSAGCCTGEEAYSIAMTLDRLIPDPESWNTTILATDINPSFLRKAAEGRYGNWSFRETPQWIRQRYFTQLADGQFEIRPQIRQRVTFSYLNLAEDAYPSLASNTNAMDVIFCRNVLMYFTPQRAKQVVEKLHASLVDGGWLVVSAVETSHALFSQFTTVNFPDVVLYRKLGNRASPVFMSAAPVLQPDYLNSSRSGGESEISPPVAALQKQQTWEAVAPAPEKPHSNEAGSREMLHTARAHANQGNFAEAIEWCGKAIAADKLDPANHYLLATVRQEQGEHELAAKSLMHALYLEPDFVLAHFGLGNLKLSQGRRREAHRHFGNVLALLQTRPQDEVLPESDGLTAGRLCEIAASLQAAVPVSAGVGTEETRT